MQTKNLVFEGKSFAAVKKALKQLEARRTSCIQRWIQRTGCRAKVYFEFDRKNEILTVTEHIMDHNHDFVPIDQRHLINSHKKLHDRELEFSKLLKSMGFNIVDGVKLLKKEVGGSPTLGFSARDVYNRLATDKRKHLKGIDANTLLDIFMNRVKVEKEFLFSFKIYDESGTLTSVFWRDARMMEDYRLFGDLLVFDTTYRTNKYDMICAPFIGVNNHTMNVMFGCGFILNERIESFQWLFRRFLDSMDNLKPTTIMTDQSASIAAGIRDVFHGVQHRLCTWHIEENSRKHIKALRNKLNFVPLFQQCLRHSKSVAQFEHLRERLLTEYDCSENRWLKNLYSIRSRWCPTYTNHIFSGDVLSSQRSESANSSIQKKLHATTDLVDFYNRFCDVVESWRSNKKTENYRCQSGVPETTFHNVSLIDHAKQIYTIEMFKLFEEFKKLLSCQQTLLFFMGAEMRYRVWTTSSEIFCHVVQYNSSNEISCTCNKFSSCDILCFHCLRIFNLHNVQIIPSNYILKRWTKLASVDAIDKNEKECVDNSLGDDFVWRLQMKRKFDGLINLSDSKDTYKTYMEEFYERAKQFMKVDSRSSRPMGNCLNDVTNDISNPRSKEF